MRKQIATSVLCAGALPLCASAAFAQDPLTTAGFSDSCEYLVSSAFGYYLANQTGTTVATGFSVF